MRFQPKKFTINYKAKFVSPENNEIRVWLARPISSLYQKIESFFVSPQPISDYQDLQGNHLLYFNFKNTKNIDIEMKIKTILWKNKINLNKNLFLSKVPFVISKRYTQSEDFLEQAQEVKKLTEKIIGKSKNALDKVKLIFDFVMNNFEYVYPVKKRGVKNLNLNKLRGDCGEYSSLFVTMCRILKIPTRNNTGFVIFPTQRKIAEHGWINIYFKPYGWLDIDTQYASLEKNSTMGIKKYFLQRSDYRITFTNGFNIPIKPPIPQNFQLNYWNKLGLPLSNKSVQTLQPIVFASRKEAKFEDSIKLK